MTKECLVRTLGQLNFNERRWRDPLDSNQRQRIVEYRNSVPATGCRGGPTWRAGDVSPPSTSVISTRAANRHRRTELLDHMPATTAAVLAATAGLL
jgi:hypothetical protein